MSTLKFKGEENRQFSDAVQKANEAGRKGQVGCVGLQSTPDRPVQILSHKETALGDMTRTICFCEWEPDQGHCLARAVGRCGGNTGHRTLPLTSGMEAFGGEDDMESRDVRKGTLGSPGLFLPALLRRWRSGPDSVPSTL